MTPQERENAAALVDIAEGRLPARLRAENARARWARLRAKIPGLIITLIAAAVTLLLALRNHG